MPEFRQDVKSIFGQALEIRTASERVQYLDQACAGDATLRAEVDELLGAISRVGNFLGDDRTLDGSIDQAILEQQGARIGPYKLLQKIGEGGMGAVYMAEQVEPVKRRVAIKIIKPGLDTRHVIARFEAERQALAMMDHPNIAKVLDAGETDLGQPYFVMELVNGIPLTKYCDDQRLPVTERLGLFMQVCQAVQHAHHKGIIHRDLKPPNVLVALYDGRPVPKVIDFGVAKATGARLTAKTLFTEFGSVIGTLEYMSPEQAERNQLDIDTRSDIYSLGVLLYELLTGSPPFRKQDLDQRGILEILRVIREEEPLRPSAKLSSLEGLPGIAACRNIEPSRLTSLMTGELDWIVMKALEKDRSRRYDTANNMARDIERYLRDEVIEARPPSTAYRLKKLLRRNKGRVLAASLLLVACLVGAIGTELGVIEAKRERVIANEQRKIAVQAAGRARQRSADLEVALQQLGTEQKRTKEAAQLERVHATELAKALGQVTIEREETEKSLAQNHLLLADAAFHGSSDVQQAKGWLNAIPERFRKWEWNYLTRKYEGGIATLRGHSQEVTSVAFSPEGRQFASASQDGTIRIWDARAGTTLRELKGHTQSVTSLAYSPDGQRLASGSRDRSVRIWNVATGDTLKEFVGHSLAVRCVAFSQDGNRIASGGDDKSIRIWDAQSGQAVKQIAAGTDIIIERARSELSVNSIAFSPDGRRIAEGAYDGHIRIWDAETGKLAEALTDTGSFIEATCVTFSPDGNLLAVSFEWGAIRIWNLKTRLLLPELRGHSLGVNCLAFSSDGARLASASNDKTLRVWDVRTGQSLFELVGHTGAVTSVAFDPNGTHLVSGSEDQTIRIWDATTGLSSLRLSVERGALYISSLAFSPDGARLAAGSFNEANIWNNATGRRLFSIGMLPQWEEVKSVCFSPDGKQLVGGKMYATRGSCEAWDITTSSLTTILKLDTQEPINCVAYSPDGNRLATSGWGNRIRLWDAKTGRQFKELSGHVQTLRTLYEVPSITFNPDGSRLASAAADKTIRIWDVNTGKSLQVLEGHVDGVLSVAYSRDGARLASGSADKTIRIWDANSGQSLLELKGHRYAVNAVCFSPDGSRLASGSADKTVRIWDAATGRFLLELKGHSASVTCVSFSPDGYRLASGSSDCMIRIWDSRTGPLFPTEDENTFRRAMWRPNPNWHREQLGAAKQTNNSFAADVQDRLLKKSIVEEIRDN